MLRPAAPARVLRGCVVALVGLGIAASGHVLAGGEARPTPLLVVAGLLVLAATMLASSARWTASRLLVALIGMQVVVHGVLWFEEGGRTADPRLAALADPAVAHQHHAAGAASSVGMVAAHLVAVVVAALVLASLDAVVAVLASLARRIQRAGLGVHVPELRSRLAVAVSMPVVGVLELGAIGRRGPPRTPAPA
jgi:hypothetical protein